MKISRISAKKILASLGDETVETLVELESGQKVAASVPAGISAGKYEVKKVSADEAVKQIEQMNTLCSGKDWTQESLDLEISSHDFGGNATLAVSAAFFKLLNPKPVFKKKLQLLLLLFEGGKHGNENLSIQEFMIVEDTLIEATRDFRTLREYLEDNLIERTVGAEGGFSPLKFNNNDALDTIQKALPGKKIALDVADTFKSGQVLDYEMLLNKYPLISIEDPYDDESWEKWTEFNSKYGLKIMVVGDDLVTTNKDRIQKAVDLKAINAVIIKPNQIGTISQTMEAVNLAKEKGLKIIVSHRGEETDDYWIADFAVYCQADFVKFGGMDRGERVAKYNRLMDLGMA